MRYITAPVSLFLCAALVFGQQVGENKKPTDTTPMFTASATLVIETVGVKTKDGKPVEGLTAKDFTVTEDGKRQQISTFDFENVDELATAAVTGPRGSADEPEL